MRVSNPIAGALCLWTIALSGLASAQDSKSNFEVLMAGPLHEAFAAPMQFNPEPSPCVAKAPPADVDEVPPDVPGAGNPLVWIKGYWAYDEEASRFLWVSGVWRLPPPDKVWLPGFWAKDTCGYRWVSGFWTDPNGGQVEYLPTPPKCLENGSSSPAPSETSVWAPGIWLHQGNRYVWGPGFWMDTYPGWVWVPNRYAWTPKGCVWVSGYWDYDLEQRGVLFAPVAFEEPTVGTAPVIHYEPEVVVDVGVVFPHLFCHTGSAHYYFGDYYDRCDHHVGFFPWFDFHLGHHGYDPIFAHHHGHHGHRGHHWIDHLHREHHAHRYHEKPRPSRHFEGDGHGDHPRHGNRPRGGDGEGHGDHDHGERGEHGEHGEHRDHGERGDRPSLGARVEEYVERHPERLDPRRPIVRERAEIGDDSIRVERMIGTSPRDAIERPYRKPPRDKNPVLREVKPDRKPDGRFGRSPRREFKVPRNYTTQPRKQPSYSPRAPQVRKPSVSPNVGRTPRVSVPQVKPPSVKTPSVRTPSVRTPSVKTPRVKTPSVRSHSEHKTPRGGGGGKGGGKSRGKGRGK